MLCALDASGSSAFAFLSFIWWLFQSQWATVQVCRSQDSGSRRAQVFLVSPQARHMDSPDQCPNLLQEPRVTKFFRPTELLPLPFPWLDDEREPKVVWDEAFEESTYWFRRLLVFFLQFRVWNFDRGKTFIQSLREWVTSKASVKCDTEYESSSFEWGSVSCANVLVRCLFTSLKISSHWNKVPFEPVESLINADEQNRALLRSLLTLILGSRDNVLFSKRCQPMFARSTWKPSSLANELATQKVHIELFSLQTQLSHIGTRSHKCFSSIRVTRRCSWTPWSQRSSVASSRKRKRLAICDPLVASSAVYAARRVKYVDCNLSGLLTHDLLGPAAQHIPVNSAFCLQELHGLPAQERSLYIGWVFSQNRMSAHEQQSSSTNNTNFCFLALCKSFALRSSSSAAWKRCRGKNEQFPRVLWWLWFLTTARVSKFPSLASNSARYFFSPLSSICDSRVLTFSDESAGHTIPIRS